MNRERFEYLCDKSEEGREDVFVNNPASREGGEVIACEKDTDTLVVKTSEGEERHWNFQEVEETLSRRDIFPYR